MVRAASLTSSVFAGLALVGLAAPRAEALEIKFPKDKPKVVFQVPDDWSLRYTPIGIELRSPERNSFIVANLMKRDRPVVDAWSKQANDSLIANGVTFDKNAKAPPQLATSLSSTHPAIPSAPADAPLNPFTLSGEPSPEMKTAPPSEIQPQEGPVATMPEMLGAIVQPDKPKIPFNVVQFYGASVAERPVDVQLVLFKVGGDDLFLMEQASGSDDGRAIAIITSVKPAG